MNKEPIVIWGAGAIGGTIGAYLIRSGVDVLFVDISLDHVKAINQVGLSVEGPIEEFTVTARAVTPDALKGTFSSIWLCTKAQHTDLAARAIVPHLAEHGHVLSLQNGLNEFQIMKAVGKSATIGAFINFGSDYLSPGRILFGGRGAVVVGELDGAKTRRLTEIKHRLSIFEPNAKSTTKIWGYLWGKLGYAAILFATALTNDSIADVLARREYRSVLTELACEMTALAECQGVVPLGFNGYDPVAFQREAHTSAIDASFEAMVLHNQKSAKSHSGIWRDLAVRKRKTEVDPQLTIPIEIAENIGLAMPLTQKLVELIQEIEVGSRPLAIETLDALLIAQKEVVAK